MLLSLPGNHLRFSVPGRSRVSVNAPEDHRREMRSSVARRPVGPTWRKLRAQVSHSLLAARGGPLVVTRRNNRLVFTFYLTHTILDKLLRVNVRNKFASALLLYQTQPCIRNTPHISYFLHILYVTSIRYIYCISNCT